MNPGEQGHSNLIMNHHHYQHGPPHGTYLPPQGMGQPHHHHHHQPAYPPHPHHGHGVNGINPYAQHPPPPHPSQSQEFRPPPPQFHQPNRPLIVSTPASYMHQYSHAMPHQMPNLYFRPPQMHPNMHHYYAPHEAPQPPPDIPSPASLPQEPPASNPASSPSHSGEAIEETSEPRYETPITSSDSVPPSPMIPSLFPLPSGGTFKAPRLPWFSVPGESFPPRKTRSTRRTIPVQAGEKIEPTKAEKPSEPPHIQQTLKSGANHETENVEAIHQPIETTTTPSSEPSTLSKAPRHGATPSIALPIVPFIPAIHKTRKSTDIGANASTEVADKPIEKEVETSEATPLSGPDDSQVDAELAQAPAAPIVPKSWADLVRTKSAKAAAGASNANPVNGTLIRAPSPGDTQTRSLADVLNSFNVPKHSSSRTDWVLPIVEPRGLINTGNMCFMNSILQALLFCGPFLMFLESIGKNVAHSFKSETPLIDAMILFTGEFRRVQPGSGTPGDKPSKDAVLAGDPFVPEYVYEAVRGLKRFSSMRRGHQQDAEEFLNFFLDVLHEECVAAMKTGQDTKQIAAHPEPVDESAGWLEVGHKQKAAVTRNVGHISGISPVTKIFGGQMRNELRISGQRSSVMREPYQSLQLDIQSNDVNNILDALRHISVPEQLQGGDFKSARGASASATKQAFIDSLPPVLILHLKRFQYNNTGGTQKIWKGIGYPLDLEIPNEAISPATRSAQNPRYKLTSVVYHHGKSATNGHYTVDVRRQDGWIRIDDTIVKKIQETDLVDPALQNRDSRKKEGQEESGWKEVSFAAKASGKIPVASNTPAKDDKVAYLLFYELQ